MRISRQKIWITLTTLFVLIFAGLASDSLLQTPQQPLTKLPSGPAAIVSLGDSTISGEGAGNYTPNTDGQNGDWCHRSTNAEVDEVHLPDAPIAINLACSGADSANVGLGNSVHYTEHSQAGQLANLARQVRVAAIVVATGANDDPQFANTLTSCFRASFDANGPGCSTELKPPWQQRVNQMVPKVVRALQDIRSIMSSAGYPSDSYQLVLQSYASPLGPDVAPDLRSLAGCPFQPQDLNWIQSTGVHVLDNGLRAAANQAGVRFLDLANAGIGHEACSGGNDIAREWFTRLTVVWKDLQNDQRAGHALQQSFHPNAQGYAQFASCLNAFLTTNDQTASCLAGSQGSLRPVALDSSG